MTPCVHKFIRSEHRGYQVCFQCGTYHSVESLPYEAVYGRDYWTHERGHSTMQEQVYNIDEHRENGVTKNEVVLRAIEVEDRSAVLEIGCAPGRLLLQLRGISQFERVIGIEADTSFEKDIREIGCHGGELIFGYFPEVTCKLAPAQFSLIVGCDIFEHSNTPEEFLAECVRLLKPGGQLLLMAPMPKKGEPVDERFFCPEEHIWIHSQEQAQALAEQAGLTGVKFTRWCVGHDLLSGRKT